MTVCLSRRGDDGREEKMHERKGVLNARRLNRNEEYLSHLRGFFKNFSQHRPFSEDICFLPTSKNEMNTTKIITKALRSGPSSKSNMMENGKS